MKCVLQIWQKLAVEAAVKNAAILLAVISGNADQNIMTVRSVTDFS